MKLATRHLTHHLSSILAWSVCACVTSALAGCNLSDPAPLVDRTQQMDMASRDDGVEPADMTEAPDCTPRPDEESCGQLQCGTHEVPSVTCPGAMVTLACGECADGLTCNMGSCCAPETDAEFCARNEAECGLVQAPNNCGEPTSVACGACPDEQMCGATNRCECASFECTPGVCGNQTNTCGELTVCGCEAGDLCMNGACGNELVLDPPADIPTGHSFGKAIALTKDTLFVGAPQAGDASTARGMVFIYERDPVSSAWSYRASLEPNASCEQLCAFGAAIVASQDGKRLLVGEPGSNRVHEYVRSDAGEWSERSVILAPTEEEDEHEVESVAFGAAIAVSQDRVAVGDPMANVRGRDEQGAFHVFEFADGLWSAQEIDELPNDSYSHNGHALAFEGDRLVVGAPGQVSGPTRRGRLHVYDYRENTKRWDRQGTARNSRITSEDAQFGHAFILDGETIIVGNPDQAQDASDSGMITQRHLDDRESETIFVIPSYVPKDSDTLGFSLVAHDDIIACGAPATDSTYDDTKVFGERSSAYVVRRLANGNLETILQFTRPDSNLYHIGYAIDLTDELVAIGAPSREESDATDRVHLITLQ